MQLPDDIPSRPMTFDQTPTGMRRFQTQLAATGVPPAQTLVVMEATGSYWMTLATTLHAAGYAIAVINPAQAHAFAKALLKRVKTDPIDAHTLTRLAALLQPAAWEPPPAVYHELVQRLGQRDDLMHVRQQFKNQLHALVQQPVVVASVRTRLENLITTLTDEIATLEAEIAPALAQEATWAAAAERLQSIPGVGLLTASWLIALTLNFTLCPSADAAAAYAGLPPNAYRSGTSVQKRACIGHTGNRRLRTALYLATLSGTQHNPILSPMYARLRAAGKPMKVARCAVARKLIRIAWAVVTKEHDVDPTGHRAGLPMVAGNA
ncbi:IS110 family transposase [Oscillochloris sp. ZM17-4]|uniref:IS110 family transposase n=1 Tax=Oscillochloris sp. ZM17-4 TaxID=2866714 RepID=UPI001C73B677|nr:IS110 family transposase [Oscillochloris sp. ZM17-4]MBX0328412.1 IS110 family transposase [Oscillochloris sp. ZM17-4]